VALQRLYVSDRFGGVAFTLGTALEGMCAGTRRASGGAEKGWTQRDLTADIPEIKKQLLVLATRLPPNAAHGVINSLTLWEEQLECDGEYFDLEKLRTQGGVWRSVLSGEVAAKDLLHLSDYIGTAEEVVARLHDFAVTALRTQLVVPALLVIALLVAGVLVMVLSDKVAAGATAVIAALGLSWKGIGQYFGKAAANGEEALWNGQLDWTVAYRATISLRHPAGMTTREMRSRRRAARERIKTSEHPLPPQQAQEPPSPGPQAREPAQKPEGQVRQAQAQLAQVRKAQVRQAHFDTWQKWLRRWPVSELDD
jgi:hypothetical protein